MACDPDFGNVVLLLHCDGTDGSTAFPDSSPLVNTVAASAGTVVSDTDPKFGDGAALIPNGATTDGLTVPDRVEFDFGTGDWCVDFWYKRELGTGIALVQKFGFTTIYPYQIEIDASGYVSANSADDVGTTVQFRTAAFQIPSDTWVYIVYQRSGSNFGLWVDGTFVTTGVVTTPYAGVIGTNAGTVQIGSVAGGTDPGHFDEIRLTKGVARYVDGVDFTPPTEPGGGACPPPSFLTIPNVVGMTLPDAVSALNAAGFVLGLVTSAFGPGPIGSILAQGPAAGTVATAGTSVNLVQTTGGAQNLIPDLSGLTSSQAAQAIRDAGFSLGSVTVDVNATVPLGTVARQSPPAFTVALLGTKVNYVVASLTRPFDVRRTVISQYATSPTILAMIDDLAADIDPRTNLDNFYNFVWNVDTAQGFGLDIWGVIVGVDRLLKIPNNADVFGFSNPSVPADWKPFNQGVFNRGANSTQAYLLPDNIYRTLILTKALANIVATSAASLNRLLRNLFPGRGRAYVIDLGGMAMQFVFEFSLTAAEYAILTQSGALPHPAGVAYSVVVVPGFDTFGFLEAGDGVQPFDQGVFYVPP